MIEFETDSLLTSELCIRSKHLPLLGFVPFIYFLLVFLVIPSV